MSGNTFVGLLFGLGMGVEGYGLYNHWEGSIFLGACCMAVGLFLLLEVGAHGHEK